MIPCTRIYSAEGNAPVPGGIPVSFASLHPKDGKQLDYSVFFPGPLYFHVMINRSLVEGFRDQYGRKHGLPIQYSVFKFKRPLITHCGEWGEMLCVMDSRSFLYFRQWLGNMKFLNRDRKLLYMAAFELTAILDPFLLDGGNQIVPETATVLCPVCQLFHVKPKLWEGVAKESAPPFIELIFTKPLPDTLENLEQMAGQLI
jgi:hypothetical protein